MLIHIEGFRPKKQLAGSAQWSSNCAAFPVRQEPQPPTTGLRYPSRLRTEAGNLLTRRSKNARLDAWSRWDKARVDALGRRGSPEQARGRGRAAVILGGSEGAPSSASHLSRCEMLLPQSGISMTRKARKRRGQKL